MSLHRFILLFVILHFCSSAYSQTVNFTSSNLPVFIINTNGIPIPNEPKITADMKVIFRDNGQRNAITDTIYHYKGKIGIEIRGSSSQNFPKKQYAVELRDTTGADIDFPLLGLPAESDWNLYAPYTDKTMLRDVMVYNIAAKTGAYASRYRFCELLLNNEYMGVYILFEKVKRDKNRVNITKCEPADTTGDALTGGYIVKVDKLDGTDTQGWYSTFLPYPNALQKIFYQYHYPKYEDIRPAQKTYIKGKIYAFENMMNGSQYADTVNGYPAYIDVPSFVDYFIINEFSKNVDGYRLSAYLHKDRDSKGGKLKAGPVWDYNLAFGNADYYEGWLNTGYIVNYLHDNLPFVQGEWFQLPFWWYKLFNESKMQAKIKVRYAQMRKSMLKETVIYGTIDSLVTMLNESRMRNYQRWPILGQYVWPNYFVGSTYSEEITYMKAFIHNRLVWLDTQFGYNAVNSDERLTAERFELLQNYPNPFNPATAIRYYLSQPGRVRLEVFDMLGNQVSELVHEQQQAGEHVVSFDANGFAQLSSGTYFYRLTTDTGSTTKKMLLLK